MKRLVMLTEDSGDFLISKSNLKYFTSMDVNAIKAYFVSRDYSVDVYSFGEFDLCGDYKGVYFLYQTSEAAGSFYKRYIEDLVYSLEKQGAIMLPDYKLLKAHHNKIFMEYFRSGFADESLKSIKSLCYGSWVDAMNFDAGFPVVIKKTASSGGAGVSLAGNRKEFTRKVKKAGRVVIADSMKGLLIDYVKKISKKIIIFFNPEKSKYLKYDVSPLSTPLILQTFVPGLKGDYKVLFFGGKYFMMYRGNRKNDFRASGSGKFFQVPENEHEGLLSFSRRLTMEIDFPIIGIDIGFDGKNYHLLEFQVIHIGTSALHRSRYWYEFHDGKWIRYDGLSNLEEEFSRSVHNYIEN